MAKLSDMKAGSAHPPAPNDEAGLVQACRRLHAAIDSLDEAVARSAGLARNDLRCLNLLEAERRSPTELSAALGLTTGSITALLDRLERKGFVRRVRSPQDRRGLLIEATPQAFERVATLYRAFGQAVVSLSEDYGLEAGKVAAQHVNDLSRACEQVVSSTKDAQL